MLHVLVGLPLFLPFLGQQPSKQQCLLLLTVSEWRMDAESAQEPPRGCKFYLLLGNREQKKGKGKGRKPSPPPPTCLRQIVRGLGRGGGCCQHSSVVVYTSSWQPCEMREEESGEGEEKKHKKYRRRLFLVFMYN
jgi:hypothetical protein